MDVLHGACTLARAYKFIIDFILITEANPASLNLRIFLFAVSFRQ
jgi:hypothetical protein